MNVKTNTRTTYVIEIADDDPLFHKISRYLNGAAPKSKPVVKSKGKLPRSAKLPKASRRGRKPKAQSALFYCLQPGCTHAPFEKERGKQVHQARTGHKDPAE